MSQKYRIGLTMKRDDKKRIEQRIKEEILKAEEDIARLAESANPVSPDNAIGRLSRLEAISARNVNKSALTQAKGRLAGLKLAQAGLNEPEFGLCLECGEPIPLPRILLMPHSKMCVTCAEEAESQ